MTLTVLLKWSGIIKYGGLVGSAMAPRIWSSGPRLASNQKVEQTSRTSVCEWYTTYDLLLSRAAYNYLGIQATELLPSF